MPSILFTESLFTFVLGFILGLKHAFEPDHMIAVSTIVLEQKNPLKAALVGTFWGIGHTTTLFITGIALLPLKLAIPQNLSLSFEFLVGVMLTILGFRTIHRHTHFHESKPAHRKHHTSLVIGGLHGLAGSGALMLLVLSTIPSLIEGLYYILLFGAGSILGMTAMSFLVGLPFLYSAGRFPQIEKILRLIAGFLSILFGLFVIYQMAIRLS